jgi:hypothetical protein
MRWHSWTWLQSHTTNAFAICIVILWEKDAKSVSFISASLFFLTLKTKIFQQTEIKVSFVAINLACLNWSGQFSAVSLVLLHLLWIWKFSRQTCCLDQWILFLIFCFHFSKSMSFARFTKRTSNFFKNNNLSLKIFSIITRHSVVVNMFASKQSEPRNLNMFVFLLIAFAKS